MSDVLHSRLLERAAKLSDALGGEQAATTVLYTPLEAKSISFSCDGTVLMDVKKYDINVD